MKKAFTLAEVLITLGIIGVVAALTLPSVVQNYQKRSLEVATQKFYSVMSQAIKQYMADEGVDDLRESALAQPDSACGEYSLTHKLDDEFLKKYLKAQICEDGCFADNYKSQDGSVIENFGKQSDDYHGRYLLPDGMVVDYMCFLVGKDAPGDLFVDVNGRKEPNKIGYDLWSMSVFYDGVLDESGLTPECRKYGNCDGNSPEFYREQRYEACRGVGWGSYAGCFGHFLENGFKFDY